MRNIFIILLAFFAISIYGWDIIEDTDIMTGKAVITMYGGADRSQNALTDPLLLVRQGTELEVFIYFGGYRLKDDIASVNVSIDYSEPVRYMVKLSSNRESVFFQDHELFLADISSASVLTISATRATNITVAGQWQMSEFLTALDNFKEVCNGYK